MPVCRSLRAWVAPMLALLAAGCGGGGGGGPPVSPAPPPAADVQVVSAAQESLVAEGAVATYVVTVSNRGPDPAAAVQVTTTLDAGQALRSIRCSASNGAVCPATPALVMQLPSLPRDGAVALTIAANVPVTGAPRDVSSSTAVQAANDPVASNNMAVSVVRTALPNRLRLQSEAGDYIGGGGSWDISSADAQFTMNVSGNQLTLATRGAERWTASFQLPDSVARVSTGTFANLTRYPFHDPARGGLSISGRGNGCNQLTGSFTITKAVYVGDQLDEMELSFEQFCETSTAALRGQLRWLRADKTLPPGPLNPPPAGLWSPPAAVTPASGSFIYLESQPGDPIVLGGTHLYTRANAQLDIVASGAGLEVAAIGNERWEGSFLPMIGLDRLEPGYYGGLRSGYNPMKGFISWRGQGRGCGVVSGWFVIDEISYSNGTLSSIDMRFEQLCEGGGGPLRGRIRLTPNDTTAPPLPVNPPPPGLWSAPTNATPASGNYVYLFSEPGEFVGQGATHLFTAPATAINVSTVDPAQRIVQITVANWRGFFEPMASVQRLQPGYYANLKRWPFHNPAAGGMSWYAGSSCDSVSWLVVDHVAFDAQGVAALDLRFEQRCERASVSLFGQIRWRRP